MNGNHAQAIIEVFAEAALGDFLLEILVGGGDYADIHVVLFRAAERPDFSFLQNAIELHLHGETHVSNLVHEKSAVMSGLKKSAPIFRGAGERAFHVAEEFGFEERLREMRRN